MRLYTCRTALGYACATFSVPRSIHVFGLEHELTHYKAALIIFTMYRKRENIELCLFDFQASSAHVESLAFVAAVVVVDQVGTPESHSVRGLIGPLESRIPR